MATITGVSIDFEETLPMFESALAIIHLDNYGSLFLSLKKMANDPANDVLRDHKRVHHVKTDGHSIFWPPDGLRLTLDEIMEMLREDGGGSG